MTSEVVIKTFTAPDGAEIKYVDEGQGVPFLFIYGMGSSVTSQDLFIKFMREHCRMIVFDQRGYGFTKAQGEIGIHQSARDAKALMEYLGIDKYILMGYSMGAAVVFSYVQQFGTGNLIKVLTGDMSPKLINEGDWKLGLYQGHYTREMYEEDLNITAETDELPNDPIIKTTKGISGLLWFLMIAFLTPVAIKQYGIMGLLIISVLALLNIFSDIFKYKMNFVNEKRIVNFLWSLGIPLPPWRSGINATW